MINKIIRNIKNFFIFKKQAKEILKNFEEKNFTNKKILVIGNSKKCLDKRMGEKIDKFDFVVRFNAAPTNGYEEYVGTKTDIIACNELVFKNKIEELSSDFNRKGIEKNFIKKQKKKIIFAVLENENINKSNYENILNHNEVIFFSNNLNHILRYIIASDYNYFKKIYYYKYKKKLSLGLIIISILQLLNLKIYIYGFDLNKKDDDYSCYYSKNKSILDNNHDFIFENNLIKKLIKENKVFNLN